MYNAAETVLIDDAIAETAVPKLIAALSAMSASTATCPASFRRTRTTGPNEYLSLDVALKVVANIDEAVAHIDRYGTGHTDAIVTADVAAAREFTARVDSACRHGQRIDCLHRR